MEQEIVAKVVSSTTFTHDDSEYELFLANIRNRFAKVVNNNKYFFTTDISNLFSVFLEALPVDCRQHYTCHACRRFVDTYGGLVSITLDGSTIPILWDVESTPVLYRNSIKAIEQIAHKAKVNGVFLTPAKVWGDPVTGEWHHMAVTPPPELLFKSKILTPYQVMAEKREDFKTLINGLLEFPIEAVEQALTILKTDSLYRSEKCLGVAEWLKTLHDQRNSTKDRNRQTNITWLAVATAPPGFCHIKIGTLLEDIISGLSFESISQRFADKMHPLKYQRPQAEPSSGNIAQAEKIIAQLNAAGSLARRFARLDDLKAIWKPKVDQKIEDSIDKSGGVFSHLKPKNQSKVIPKVSIPPITITWDKFYRTILSEAEKIEFYVPTGRCFYSALVTAVNPDSPPIIQWDYEDERNPVSWYLYCDGSFPNQWNLKEREYHNITAVCFQPSMWNESKKCLHQGESVFFIIENCKDSGYVHAGNALFPEILKSEFHAIRSTIEAYSRSALRNSETNNYPKISLHKTEQIRTIFPIPVTDVSDFHRSGLFFLSVSHRFYKHLL